MRLREEERNNACKRHNTAKGDGNGRPSRPSGGWHRRSRACSGPGGYYAYNGGWKTASQQEEAYKHEMLPIIAAKHGDKEPLEAENRLRQEHGQPPLEMPKDKQQILSDNRSKLADLQKQLEARQGR